MSFPSGSVVKNPPADAEDIRNISSIPGSKEMAVSSSVLAWKSHGQRSLAGYGPWGPKESDTTERLSTK